jgi:hypothetical protein
LVSVERDAQEDARQILDALNGKLESLGLEQFTDRDQVEAVIYIVVRKEHSGGGIIGRTSNAKVMAAVLEFLIGSEIISEDFAATVFAHWMMERDARKK